jgi:hypothetical protein
MPKVTYEIKFKPVDESTLNVPKKKIGVFFQEKTLPQKSLAYIKVRFYVAIDNPNELDEISKVVYRVPLLGVSVTKDNKMTEFEFNLTTSEKEFTLLYEIHFINHNKMPKQDKIEFSLRT